MIRETTVEDLDRPGPPVCEWCHQPAARLCDEAGCRALMCEWHTVPGIEADARIIDLCPTHGAHRKHKAPRPASPSR